MDGATSVSKLVKKILDLISEVLVLPLDNIQLFSHLIVGGLQSKQLRAVVSSFILRCLHLHDDVISLGLPLALDLLKVLASLLCNQRGGMDALKVHSHFLQLSCQSSSGLLNIGYLGL